MLNINWFKSKKLTDVLYKTKRVKINGVLFDIRKINPLDYLSGAQVMQEFFSLYRSKPTNQQVENLSQKVKSHYTDVFMAGVVKPNLSRKADDGEFIYVGDIMVDMDMATKLYTEIYALTYGKKKMKVLHSPSLN